MTSEIKKFKCSVVPLYVTQENQRKFLLKWNKLILEKQYTHL